MFDIIHSIHKQFVYVQHVELSIVLKTTYLIYNRQNSRESPLRNTPKSQNSRQRLSTLPLSNSKHNSCRVLCVPNYCEQNSVFVNSI